MMKFNKHDENALQNINFTTKKRKIDSKCVIWASILKFLITLKMLKESVNSERVTSISSFHSRARVSKRDYILFQSILLILYLMAQCCVYITVHESSYRKRNSISVQSPSCLYQSETVAQLACLSKINFDSQQRNTSTF